MSYLGIKSRAIRISKKIMTLYAKNIEDIAKADLELLIELQEEMRITTELRAMRIANKIIFSI